MKKSLIQSALHATVAGIAFLALGAAQAQTNSGNIEFAGQVSPSTCSVMTPAMRFDMVSAKPTDFTAIGDVKGETPFSITLRNCTIGKDIPNKATVKFSGSNINVNNRLNNLGTAVGLDIAINSSSGNALTTPAQFDLVAGENKLNFTAAYHATKAAITSGSVLSLVNFDITYQ